MSGSDLPTTTDIALYCGCMEEIKLRQQAIGLMDTKAFSTPYPITNIEFACLQIRKILELIALAALTAHKQEYSRFQKGFAKERKAKNILAVLGKLNPGFYPLPGKQILNETAGGVREVVPIIEPYLS